MRKATIELNVCNAITELDSSDNGILANTMEVFTHLDLLEKQPTSTLESIQSIESNSLCKLGQYCE